MDTGELSWAVTASALVLFMTPGVAFFYGGLVKARSVVSMMMMSFGAIGLIAVIWILYGFNMSSVASPSAFAGNPLSDFALDSADNETLIGALFGATFAIITVALISGAIADRAKFSAWLIFAGAWATFVYFPVAAWVWGGGWIMHLGSTFGLDYSVIDYAGGTAVHINAGAAALALALVLGKRVDFGRGANKPHNVPLVVLGAAILWFGWFGFNVGAQYLSGMDNAGLIAINTLGASAAAVMGWLVVEKIKGGKPTSVGACSGAVAGLVAITPSCANLTPGWGLLLGLVAGVVCALAVELKYRLGFDDSLDVVGIHMVGGLIGTAYLGLFATHTGLLVGGDVMQLVMQLMAAGGVLVYSFGVAFAIGWLINRTIGFRVASDDEIAGIDTVVHGEEGYVLELVRDE
ncbi:Amt family ammonium transporter [Cryobacterium mesophilum]|uniref:Ammonium transporter n=1 Tax=Terrimesophilobacter mesophilus TaxID=433647 RepID=A0A4R8VA77_9MICO|nr:ammonium transporter [Terrimesophilobacter mesophilus]MBB5631844.1 Amt family ammonium transporter [Terrimesophilobacter mesophilus]TFB78757.1 ammonium transporter [Terrimesophilobacter mesophilus]